ncbi:hypothetical protein L6164_004629 [Bauhinia variegata]|uniref:Uncharacterized protein n=1 Tax=Bauhinia variegata TaxID=167791 RepID=A0ACB9Q504_BAUVA|nr:hypothetical protein L6164_004629 [Bauhinia variegata]
MNDLKKGDSVTFISMTSDKVSMGELGTASDNHNYRPICSIAQDHLFTILLLLPVQSILSLSMTCKRFRALACSDTLWESVCRRDWGSRCVDALKSSNHFPWMRLYKQLSQMDSFACYDLSRPDCDLDFPAARASHSLNFVSDCLVLFGGGCEGGRHLDDTWAAYIGNDFQRIPKWHKVNSGIPSGRFGHTCVELGDFLVLFGGIDDHGNRQNDTWVGQVTYVENVGITCSWKLLMLDAGAIAPPPRGAHAASSIDNKRMVIHGGIGLQGIRLGDAWVLELSENLSSGTWHEIVTHPSPPARSGHTLTCIGRSRIILFGGRGLGYEVLDDVWLLDTWELGYPTWVQILYIPPEAEGVALRRVGHSATVVLGGWLLIHGGEDTYRHRKDDFWVFDIRAISLQQPDSLTKMWKRLRANGYQPRCRSFHRACADHSGRYVYVFGGMVDEFLQPPESSGLRFDGDLFLVDLVLHL